VLGHGRKSSHIGSCLLGRLKAKIDSKITLQYSPLGCKLLVYHYEEACHLPFVSRRAVGSLDTSGH
jgi:hypothetical protein